MREEPALTGGEVLIPAQRKPPSPQAGGPAAGDHYGRCCLAAARRLASCTPARSRDRDLATGGGELPPTAARALRMFWQSRCRPASGPRRLDAGPPAGQALPPAAPGSQRLPRRLRQSSAAWCPNPAGPGLRPLLAFACGKPHFHYLSCALHGSGGRLPSCAHVTHRVTNPARIAGAILLSGRRWALMSGSGAQSAGVGAPRSGRG